MSAPPNIILVGFMGAGKTSTGKELSKTLNFDFLDMDYWIEEKNGKKISSIFEENGENYFRSQEKEAINWVRSKRYFVISTGGGVWINKENREDLLKMGWCVWLKVSPELALKRIGNNLAQRPLLEKSDSPLKTIELILRERNPLYSLAHKSFDTADKNMKEISSEIIHVLKEERPFDLPFLQK